MPNRPRLTPYSYTGIRRVPCARCGEPARHQWNVCADAVNGAPRYRAICPACDVALNRLVMEWMLGDTEEVRRATLAYELANGGGDA